MGISQNLGGLRAVSDGLAIPDGKAAPFPTEQEPGQREQAGLRCPCKTPADVEGLVEEKSVQRETVKPVRPFEASEADQSGERKVERPKKARRWKGE